MWPDSAESRGCKVARGRYPGVRGEGRRVHQSSPLCSQSRSRQRGGERRQVLPLTPSSSPLPSLPPSLSAPSLPASPARLRTSEAPGRSVPSSTPLAPTLSSHYLAPTFPGDARPGPLHNAPCPTCSRLRGGGGVNLQNHCFREMRLFVRTFPANQREQSTLASSFCQFFHHPKRQNAKGKGSTPEDIGSYTIGGGTHPQLYILVPPPRFTPSTQHTKTTQRGSKC